MELFALQAIKKQFFSTIMPIMPEAEDSAPTPKLDR
jgi:hypothetical protein